MQLLTGLPPDVLVDADHGLPRWYNPGLNVEMLQAFEDMSAQAEQDGIKVEIYSAYRSYPYQSSLLARERDMRGMAAEMVLSLPGHSEHQLGTALDVVWPGLQVSTKDDRNEKLFRWLEANAHLFGFVLSYPMKGVEDWPYDNRIYPEVTEFIHEPWHIRYVGVELAEKIFQAGYLDPNTPTLPQDFFQPWP